MYHIPHLMHVYAMFGFIFSMPRSMHAISIYLCSKSECMHDVFIENHVVGSNSFITMGWNSTIAVTFCCIQSAVLYMRIQSCSNFHVQFHLLTFGDFYYWVIITHYLSLWSNLHKVPYMKWTFMELNFKNYFCSFWLLCCCPDSSAVER